MLGERVRTRVLRESPVAPDDLRNRGEDLAAQVDAVAGDDDGAAIERLQ